ncbi:MAG: hypothetical protein IT158_17330 [Bryobacterales bacterium]|nr:hypothetical protein [Bryobacterales bacterium]
MQLRVGLIAAVAAGGLLSGCGSVRIANILADPAHYQRRNVSVDGTVTNSFGALVAGVYQVEDDTGRIYVISNGAVPSKGAKVKVKGRVMGGVTVMGKSFGTAIRERKHDLR